MTRAVYYLRFKYRNDAQASRWMDIWVNMDNVTDVEVSDHGLTIRLANGVSRHFPWSHIRPGSVEVTSDIKLVARDIERKVEG